MHIRIWGALAPIIALAACQQAAVPPEPADPQAALDAIHQAEEAQMAALNADDTAAATAVYTADSVLYVDGAATATGPEGILAYMDGAFADPAFAVSIDEASRRNWVAASGELAVTSFTGSWTRTEDGEVVTSPIVNQTVWQKQDDGSWRNVSDVNMALPVEAGE